MKLMARVNWFLHMLTAGMLTAVSIVLLYTYHLAVNSGWKIVIYMNTYGEGPYEYILFILLIALGLTSMYELAKAPIWGEKDG